MLGRTGGFVINPTADKAHPSFILGHKCFIKGLYNRLIVSVACYFFLALFPIAPSILDFLFKFMVLFVAPPGFLWCADRISDFLS